MTILIKGGRVLNPATGMDKIADVLIEDDKIRAIGQNIPDKADEMIPADRCFVMPGFIDLHVHFREPGYEQKETIHTGMQAAARGGFTSVFAMPNTNPPVDCAKTVHEIYQKAEKENGIHMYQVGAMTKGQHGEEPADILGMADAGIPAVSEDGKSIMNAQLCLEIMKLAASRDIPVLSHCEDRNMVRGGVVNDDERAVALRLSGITNAVEDVIIARDILLAKQSGCRLHLCHCSTADSVKMVKAAKEEGLPITAEVCPHHFTLTSQDIPDSDNTNFKMNPPLRTKKDVKALKEGLQSGIMDVIATDHAPHTEEEKNTSMEKAPFGITGLETAASLVYSELVLGGWLTPLQMAEKMSWNPARIMNLQEGDIRPGKSADLVIFDPSRSYVIDKNSFASKGRNTPFHGRKVTGRVLRTVCRGRTVYDYKKEKEEEE